MSDLTNAEPPFKKGDAVRLMDMWRVSANAPREGIVDQFERSTTMKIATLKFENSAFLWNADCYELIAQGAPVEPPFGCSARQDLTLRELQTNLPWTVRYSADFRANPQSHKDFAHGLLHIVKAAGYLSALVDSMDHDKSIADQAGLGADFQGKIADMVICALRMANTFPGGVIDLQRAVEDRLESKNKMTLSRPRA